MPRKGPVPPREVVPDARYHSDVITRFINKIMIDGKKSIAQRICYEALDRVGEQTGRNPLEVLEQALRNTAPMLEVRPRRVGGATYQVPMEVRPQRRLSLSMRWIVRYAREREGRSMIEKLAAEIIDAANNTGGAVRRKEEVHRMAESNRAFAHYRW